MFHLGIHSPPRCGSTWVGEMFNADPSIRYAYQPYYANHSNDTGSNISDDRVMADLEAACVETDNMMISKGHARKCGLLPEYQENYDRDVYGFAYKETRYHNILPERVRHTNIKFILLTRDPREAILSWQKSVRWQLPWGDEVANDWLECKGLNDEESEFNGYSGWVRAMTIFKNLEENWPLKVRLFKYEDINADPITFIREARGFAGPIYPMSEEVEGFIAASRHNNHSSESPFSVYRNKNQEMKWPDELDPSIADYITNDLSKLKDNGLDLGYI